MHLWTMTIPCSLNSCGVYFFLFFSDRLMCTQSPTLISSPGLLPAVSTTLMPESTIAWAYSFLFCCVFVFGYGFVVKTLQHKEEA